MEGIEERGSVFKAQGYYPCYGMQKACCIEHTHKRMQSAWLVNLASQISGQLRKLDFNFHGTRRSCSVTHVHVQNTLCTHTTARELEIIANFAIALCEGVTPDLSCPRKRGFFKASPLTANPCYKCYKQSISTLTTPTATMPRKACLYYKVYSISRHEHKRRPSSVSQPGLVLLLCLFARECGEATNQPTNLTLLSLTFWL